MGKLSKIAWLYIAAVITAASVVVVLGPHGGIHWPEVITLGLLVAASESIATLLKSRSLAWSSSSVASLAAVVLTGPVGAAVVACCTLLAIRRGPSPMQRLFNAGMYAVSAYLAGEVYLLFGGQVGPPGTSEFPGIFWPYAVATLAHVIVNFALLQVVFWLSGEQHSTTTGLSLKLLVTDVGYGAFGVLIAALWSVVGPFTPVLVLIPLFVARWAVGQFAAQQSAYEATVSALCQAVETKDFYTRGHSERVSKGSVMIAKETGMRAERIEAIRFAGMLHDVGKLGVPTAVLQKSGKLTDDEYAAVQLHPMRGLDIVRDIGFLDEALAGIMHHHERIDGRGYPMGLAGDEIPEFARVLSVADAFDAMTSTRSYSHARPVADAIAELRKWAGKQFDPAFVDAFVAAIERDGWTGPQPALPAPVAEPDASQVAEHIAAEVSAAEASVPRGGDPPYPPDSPRGPSRVAEAGR